jgi:hypothetical protein
VWKKEQGLTGVWVFTIPSELKLVEFVTGFVEIEKIDKNLFDHLLKSLRRIRVLLVVYPR